MSISEQYTPEEASITTVMIAHQVDWTLDNLVILDSKSPKQVSFHDLTKELENMNLGRRMRGTHVDQSLRVLSIARLCAVERRGNPPVINVVSTELGRASLTAYKAYEEIIMGSYIDYSAKAMEDRMDTKEAERFARSLTIGSLGKKLNLGRTYKFQEEDFEDFKSRRGFYRLPIALKALNAQSAPEVLYLLYRLSERHSPPKFLPTLHQEFDVLSMTEDPGYREVLLGTDLFQEDTLGLAISEFGEGSLEAFAAYSEILHQFIAIR